MQTYNKISNHWTDANHKLRMIYFLSQVSVEFNMSAAVVSRICFRVIVTDSTGSPERALRSETIELHKIKLGKM